MAQPALLLLAHQARSYVAMAQHYTARLGIACLVLSSRARDQRDLEQLTSHVRAHDSGLPHDGHAAEQHVDRVWVVDEEYLAAQHLDPVLAEACAEGYEIVAALATFEGYRVLMAQANQRLGAPDADAATLGKCMDKYRCRRTLVRHGLSRADAVVLDAHTLPALRAASRKLFVKPRRGAGSFACFRLDDTLSAQRLRELQRQMREDQAFRAIFAGQFDFIAEDYLPGDEYSFEVMVADGRSYVIGVHAKYLDESSGTTLETKNSCPAPRLSDAWQLAGEHYIAQCLVALRLDEGCYHIETRHDPRDNHWDIIEINARMGGALINQSIEVFTGGVSMLELWVRLLCSGSPAQRDALHAQLSALRESTRRRERQMSDGTVFCCRYGQRNRVLQHISVDGLPCKPDICDLPVRPGTRLPDSERGIFILSALWKVPVADIPEQLQALPAMLDEALVVQYTDRPEPAPDLQGTNTPQSRSEPPFIFPSSRSKP